MNKKNQHITVSLAEDINRSREAIRLSKPEVYRKLMVFLERQEKDIFPGVSLLDWAYSFDCNYTCEHCGTSLLNGNTANQNQKMPLEKVRSIADQAHEIGFFTISFIGGEPLMWPELDSLVKTVGPERFFITVLTNGWLLNEKRALSLAQAGVNKIGISIDSGIKEEHDRFRNKEGAFERAIRAVDNAQSAGMRVHISTTVTHQNLRSDGIKKILDYSHEKNISIDLQCATVAGRWQNNYEALIDASDVEYIHELRHSYPLIRRDLLPTPGCKGGCPALTGSVFLTAAGDVLPCLFIHLSLGNVYETPLDEILKRGTQISELMAYSNLCLAGEDVSFIEKYLFQTFGTTQLPLSWDEGFNKFIQYETSNN